RRDPVSDHEARGAAVVLPLELIRRDPERVRRAAQLKGEDAPIDQILELDRRWREHLHAAETIKADQNRLSKEFAQTRDESLKVRLAIRLLARGGCTP